MAEGENNKKSNNNNNSATPTLSDRNKNDDEGESLVDTIEDYSDEGFDDEDEEYDENSHERRVRFKVGSFIHIKHSISLYFPFNYFQFSSLHSHAQKFKFSLLSMS